MSAGAPTAPEIRDTTLAAQGITVRLSGRTILDDVTFTIGRGEFTGLIGANGAGKTTLFRVILGLQTPTRGHVHISDDDRSGRHVGYVPQKFLLDPDMPVRGRDLVGLGLDGHKLGLALPSRSSTDDRSCRRRAKPTP